MFSFGALFDVFAAVPPLEPLELKPDARFGGAFAAASRTGKRMRVVPRAAERTYAPALVAPGNEVGPAKAESFALPHATREAE